MDNRQQIHLENLSLRYRGIETSALKHISVDAEFGHVIGIIGNHHAGKTSLCRALAGIVPTIISGDVTGTIQVGSLSPNLDWQKYNQQTGVVLQNPAGQLSGLADTVADEIAFDLINQGVPADQIKRRVLNVADQLGLGDQLNQSPGTLSGGQKQRLAIATAIVTDPSMLVLDDPTSEMDPLGRQHFFSWLVSVEKKTIFIVSNEVDDLCEIADQIWVLKAGELVAAGKPLTVFNHLKPDWQLAEPTVFRLAKLMKWSIPGGADEFPVTNQQLEEAYYAAN